MDRDLKLNAGCGDDYREGSWVNLDIDPSLTPDVAHDLNELPWPFDHGTFDSVLMSHVVEHLYSPYRTLYDKAMHLLKFHRLMPEETVYRCRVVKNEDR